MNPRVEISRASLTSEVDRSESSRTIPEFQKSSPTLLEPSDGTFLENDLRIPEKFSKKLRYIKSKTKKLVLKNPKLLVNFGQVLVSLGELLENFFTTFGELLHYFWSKLKLKKTSLKKLRYIKFKPKKW